MLMTLVKLHSDGDRWISSSGLLRVGMKASPTRQNFDLLDRRFIEVLVSCEPIINARGNTYCTF
jgi:hypothetical protein